MKFTINTKELLKGIEHVSYFITPNKALSIIENVLFDIQDNKLKLITTDLTNTISYVIQLENCNEEYILVLPYKLLKDTLKYLPDTDITIEIGENNCITINCNGDTFSLTGESAENFPLTKHKEFNSSITIATTDIVNAINYTSFAVSKDELRPALCGVNMEVKDNRITFTATDAYVLSTFSFDTNDNSDTSYLFDSKLLSFLTKNKILCENIHLSFNEDYVWINYSNIDIYSRLIKSKYVSYKSIITNDHNLSLLVNRKEIIQKIKDIIPFCNNYTKVIIFNLANDILEITAEDIDNKKKATKSITCEYTSDSLKIGFNSQLLLNTLSVLKSDNIIFEFLSKTSSVYIKEENNDNLLLLIIPYQYE